MNLFTSFGYEVGVGVGDSIGVHVVSGFNYVTSNSRDESTKHVESAITENYSEVAMVIGDKGSDPIEHFILTSNLDPLVIHSVKDDVAGSGGGDVAARTVGSVTGGVVGVAEETLLLVAEDNLVAGVDVDPDGATGLILLLVISTGTSSFEP